MSFARLLAGSVCAVLAAPLAVPSQSPSQADAFVRVSPRDARYFELSDGSPYIPIGLNLIAPPGRDLAGMEHWMQQLGANGGNFIRVWLSNPFFNLEVRRSGEYDPAKAQRIADMLAGARQHGLRVKLCLEHFRHLGDGRQNWAGKPLHLVANGGTAANIADFFDGVRANYRRLALMPENDVAQVHRYLDLGARLDVCKGPVNRLAAEAVNELLVTKPGKPVILAESGAVEPSHSGPFKLYAVDTNGVILHDVLFAPFFAGAAGPGHIWHWDAYVAKNNLWWHFARFAEAVRGIDPPAEHFQPAILPHGRLDVAVLEGNRTWLIWCRDTKNDWRSELQDGIAPERLSGTTLDLGALAGKLKGANARAYDPWRDRWSDTKIAGGKITLPDFQRSLVVKITRAD